jgi:hypothetical protein
LLLVLPIIGTADDGMIMIGMPPSSSMMMPKPPNNRCRPFGPNGQDTAATSPAMSSISASSCRRLPAAGGPAQCPDWASTSPCGANERMTSPVSEATRVLAERGVIREGAPILLKLVTQVAARFGVVVTQKVAAQALPIVGALGGAAVNYAFIEPFQDVARGHFTVRRLERIYGKETIRTA